MKKSKDYAKEIIAQYDICIKKGNYSDFKTLMANVWYELTYKDVNELIIARNVKLDSGLIAILKDQRNKYKSICNIVNFHHDLLSVSDFDDVIRLSYPNIYDWYRDAISS
jgi:hypothetical protein